MKIFLLIFLFKKSLIFIDQLKICLKERCIQLFLYFIGNKKHIANAQTMFFY